MSKHASEAVWMLTDDRKHKGPLFARGVSFSRALPRLFGSVHLLIFSSEMSFSMGRPDTLGADLYHNRQFPLLESDQSRDGGAITLDPETLEPPHCAIIKIMVDLSRIIKSIGLDIYLSDQITLRTVELAFRLQADLDQWAETVPLEIRPRPNVGDLVTLKSARDSQWVKRQRLVLTLRE